MRKSLSVGLAHCLAVNDAHVTYMLLPRWPIGGITCIKSSQKIKTLEM